MRDQTDLRGQSQRHPGRSVKNFRSCQSDAHGRGCAAGERTNATDVSRASLSGRNPISRGVREKSRPARTHIVTAMTTPIVAAASGKPSTLMPATQSCEKTTHPMLAPLYAMDSAARRGAQKPRRDDSVDWSGAHRRPARAAEECGDKELPGCGGTGPAEDANG